MFLRLLLVLIVRRWERAVILLRMGKIFMELYIFIAIVLASSLIEGVIWMLTRKPAKKPLPIEDWLDDRYDRIGDAIWGPVPDQKMA